VPVIGVAVVWSLLLLFVSFVYFIGLQLGCGACLNANYELPGD
jgi:hypothetical protein